MVAPIDYSIPRPDFAQKFTSGLQMGAGIREVEEGQRKAAEAEQLKAQYAKDLQAALSNPTASSFAALSAKYPSQREAFKQSWELLSKERQDAEFLTGAKAYNALSSGNPDAAKKLIDERILAMDNSGEDSTKLKAMRDALDRDPKMLQGQLGLVLSSIDPERWAKAAAEMRAAQKAPAELTEAQAKAQKAAVDSKFAESSAALDLQKKGWDITKIQEDIKIARQNASIAAANAAISREGNDLKRQELRAKLQDMQQKRDDSIREKVANVDSARANMDNMLNTADRILNTPVSVVESATGPISTRLPTLAEDTADFEELVNTMSSQAFLAQIPNIKGMGALSNAEGEKLQSALQNLSLRQSRARLIENVKEAQRLILKGRKTLSERNGVPDTIPDTPSASAEAATGKSVDAILQELGVQ